MKLADLRSAIRGTKGNPSLAVELAGTALVLPLQKTPLLAALGAAFNDQRGAETGMVFDPETLFLQVENGPEWLRATEPGNADAGTTVSVSLDLDEDDAPAASAPFDLDLDL